MKRNADGLWDAETVERECQSRNLILTPWPKGVYRIFRWHDDDDLVGFLDLASNLGLRLVMGEKTTAGYAQLGITVDGALHVITQAEDEELEDDEEFDEDEDMDDFDPDDEEAEARYQVRWAEEEIKRLPEKLRPLAEALAADVSVDFGREETVDIFEAHTKGLNTREYQQVVDAARSVFYAKVEPELDAEAQRLAPSVVEHPDFWPFLEPSALDLLIERTTSVSSKRLRTRIAHWVDEISDQRGLPDKAREEIHRLGEKIRLTIPQIVLDWARFSSRHARKAELIDEFLEDQPEHFISLLRHAILEETPSQVRDRECRYATAARLMLKTGKKGETASKLGISPATMERILRDRPRNVRLEASDALFEHVPELRGLV